MIRLYNGKLLSMNGHTDIKDYEVWVEEDMILYVGPASNDHPVFDREIDLKGNLLMPGFKNAHTHSAMTFLRTYADGLPLQEWLFTKIFPLEAKLSPEAVYAFTRLATLEYLAGGITSTFDMYFYRDAYVQACIDSGFRTVLCGALSAGDDLSVGEMDYLKYNRIHPLIGYRFGIHAEYTSNTDVLMVMKQMVDEHKAGFWCHNSETRREVDECIERHGLTPTALFEEYGLFEHGGGGFHCVYLNDEDMDIFRRRNLWAVSCPASNAKLASGIAPITEMQKRKLNLAIGTDGPSSNNSLNMFREMYLMSVLQKLRQQDAAAGDAASILKMATSGGALAMGLTDCDAIAPGKKADMIVIDLHKPNMQPVHDTVKNLVYSGSDSNVVMTMIGGKVLYENGVFHIGDSPEHIYEMARRETDRIVNG